MPSFSCILSSESVSVGGGCDSLSLVHMTHGIALLKASMDESNAHTLSRLLPPAVCAKGNTAARIAVEGGAPSIQLTVKKGAVTNREAIVQKEKGSTVILCGPSPPHLLHVPPSPTPFPLPFRFPPLSSLFSAVLHHRPYLDSYGFLGARKKP